MVQIETPMVSEKAELRKNQQNGAIIKWRDVQIKVSQGSILCLILLIKHPKNRVETKLNVFEEDMKCTPTKRADERVLENRIRIQREFVKLMTGFFLRKPQKMVFNRCNRHSIISSPDTGRGKVNRITVAQKKCRVNHRLSTSHQLLCCYKKENAIQMGQKQEKSLQNRQSNSFALLPHGTA